MPLKPYNPILLLLRFLLNRNWKIIIIFLVILNISIPIVTLALSFYQTNYPLKTIEQVLEKEDSKPKIKTVERVYYPVMSVIDGDSFVVLMNNELKEIRLLGINTPEIDNPRQCYGLEAKQKSEDLLIGQSVFLLPDLKNTDKDIYGRSLRYAYLKDNTQVNALLLKSGFARFYDNFPLAYSQYYAKLEQEAQKNKVGLWGNCE